MSIPPPPRWLRMVLQVVWPAVGAALTIVMVAVIPVGLLLWPVDRRLRVVRVMMLALVAMWEEIGLVVRCWWLWLRALVVGRETWVEDHEEVVLDALEHVLAAARRWVGFQVEVEGEIDWGDDGEPLVVLARHAGPADSLAMAWLLAGHARRVPRIVLADALLWAPGVAIVLRRLASCFVPSHSGAGDDRARGVAELAASLGPRDALLIFPEGRNWTPARHEALVRSLREKGEVDRAEQAARWPHVLPPRPNGVVTILEEQTRCDVMVAAHTGLELLGSPRAVWRSIPFENRLLVRTWTWERADIPDDPEGARLWLDEQWGEVDAWVGSHHR